jgi:hypothetical protein
LLLVGEACVRGASFDNQKGQLIETRASKWWHSRGTAVVIAIYLFSHSIVSSFHSHSLPLLLTNTSKSPLSAIFVRKVS